MPICNISDTRNCPSAFCFYVLGTVGEDSSEPVSKETYFKNRSKTFIFFYLHFFGISFSIIAQEGKKKKKQRRI